MYVYEITLLDSTQFNSCIAQHVSFVYISAVCLPIDDELLYLDPHTCQPYEDFTRAEGSDESYHCPYKCRMNVSSLDPSIALVRDVRALAH